MNAPPATYTVQVDDKFHYMDQSYRVQDATFGNLEEAVRRCEAITNASLRELHEDGMNAGELHRQYTQFGEDPWVAREPNDGSKPPFSARTYAQARYPDICKAEDEASTASETVAVDDVPRGVPEQLFAMLARQPARKVLELASDEVLLRRTLAADYPMTEERDLAPDSQEAAEAATMEDRTMHCASLTWARLRSDGQALLIEAVKKAVWQWEEAVDLLKFWAAGELPEDEQARRQQEAQEEQEEQEWREQQRRKMSSEG